MKKVFLLSLVGAWLLCFCPLQAQTGSSVQKFDFETWEDDHTPKDWTTTMNIKVDAGIMTLDIVKLNFGDKSSEAHDGSFALKLTPQTTVGQSFTGGIDIPAMTMPGIAQLGKNQPVTLGLSDVTQLMGEGTPDMSDLTGLMELLPALSNLYSPGIKSTMQPASVEAYVKFSPDEDCSAIILLSGTKNGNTVCQGSWVNTEAITEWTRIAFEVTYIDETPVAPDSIQMIIVCGGDSAHYRSVLYVDDITISGEPLSIASLKNTAHTTQVFPNPVPAGTKCTLVPEDAMPFEASLHDMTGKKVWEKFCSGNHTTEIDVTNLKTGIYILKMKKEQGIETRKIVILN